MRRILGLLLAAGLSAAVFLFATPIGWDLILRERVQTVTSTESQSAQKPKAAAPAKSATSVSRSTPAQDVPKTSPELTPEMVASARAKMLQLINEERAKAGVKPLEYYAKADPVAQYRAEDMVKRKYFSHIPPGETAEMIAKNDPHSVSCDSLLRQAGILGVKFSAAGENIYTEDLIDLATVIADAHTYLMNSPGHRRNILSHNFTHVAIGIARGSVVSQEQSVPERGYTLVQIFLGSASIP